MHSRGMELKQWQAIQVQVLKTLFHLLHNGGAGKISL